MASTLNALYAGRDSLIHVVDVIHTHLRAYIANPGFAKPDACRIIRFISAHTNPHARQFNEVKADKYGTGMIQRLALPNL